jgi:hypothetical protein
MSVAQWRAERLEGDLGARLISSSRGLRIVGLMRVFASSSASILVSLPLCFQSLNTLLSMYFVCNSMTHVITLYSSHVCVVLCVNALVLTTRIDPG